MSDFAHEGELTDDGQPLDAAQAAPPADQGATAPPAPAGEGEPWQGPTQQEWEAQQQYLAQLQPFVEQFGQFQQELAGLDQQGYGYEQQGFDPADPEQFQQYVDMQVQERLAPYEPLLGAVAEQQGEMIARQSLDQIQQEIGNFDQDQAILLAQVFMQQGYTPEQSLVGAAQAVQQYEKQIGEAAVEAYKQQLSNAAGATPTVPSAPGAAVENPGTPTGRDRYEVIAEQWLSRSNPATLG